MKTKKLTVLFLSLLLSPLVIAEQAGSEKTIVKEPTYKQYSVDELINSVSENEGKRFVIDRQLSEHARLSGIDIATLNYVDLLSILRVWGYTVRENEQIHEIIPLEGSKHLSNKIIAPELDLDIPGDLIVTTIIPSGELKGLMLLPILRPLTNQYAYLAYISSAKAFMVTDHYSNIKKIITILNTIKEENQKVKYEGVRLIKN